MAVKNLVQLSFVIGVIEPISIFVKVKSFLNVDLTDRDINQKVDEVFEIRPFSIQK